jgi:hypothetical protein
LVLIVSEGLRHVLNQQDMVFVVDEEEKVLHVGICHQLAVLNQQDNL